MLPLTLLKAAENHPMLIELKNGDTYNGRLVSCNVFMNVCLKDVICTSKDGDKFWKIPECYIRGNSIKYLRIPEEVIDAVAVDEERDRKASFSRGGGARGGRGAGRIGGRGGPGRAEDGGRGGRGDGRGRGGRDGGRGGRDGGRGGRDGGRSRGEGRGAGRGRNN